MSDPDAPFSGDPNGRMTPNAARIRDLAADLDDAGDHRPPPLPAALPTS